MHRWFAFGVGLILFIGVASQQRAEESQVSSDEYQFQEVIRPLLSDRCFKCHGPDEKTRKAKLRLDTKEGLLRKAKSGKTMLQPGKAVESELYLRLVAHDEEELMPPPSSKLKLSKEEIASFAKWINEGAKIPEKAHWAFNPVRLEDSTNQSIDSILLAGLTKQGMNFNKPATKEALLRRVTLDLTGLPPTLEELDAFTQDAAPDAYSKVVKRLLASPRYGEQMAAQWLDLARYADTFGYQSDVEMNMYPWRDWVISAFNRNLPYNDFITWQLAGDLLPNATQEQYLATAFNRLHRQTNEGGSIEEEFRQEYVSDRVHTFGTAFLGLSLECARCHDHKYDPITQKDYYQFAAFFNSIDESGLYSHFTFATPTPNLTLYGPGDQEKHRMLLGKITELEKKKDAFVRQWKPSGEAKDVVAAEPAALFHFDSLEKNQLKNEKDKAKPGSLHDQPQLVEGKIGKAMKFSGDNYATLAGVGVFKRTDAFSFSLWLQPTEKQERTVVLHNSRAWTDSGSRGYELLLENGKPSFSLIHFYPGNAIHVRAAKEVPLKAWTHVTVTYDGSSKAAGISLYINGAKQSLEVVRDSLYREIQHLPGDMDNGAVHLTLAGRFRDVGFKNGMIDELAVYGKCLTWAEAALAFDAKAILTDKTRKQHQLHQSAEYLALEKEWHTARVEESTFIQKFREIMVMKDLPTPRKTYLLKRGSYTMPDGEVFPDTPAAVHPFEENLPKNRLGLAKWLTDPKNPLTARVAVNRVWKMHFGKGIVASVEEFGSQGQLPSHPQLLDYLAGWLVRNNWDLKALHELVVTSTAYQQESLASAELRNSDLENRRYSRGPRHRLSAEQIRDGALSISGLLQEKLGGPSVKPYQPAGLWEEAGTGKSYHQDHGEKLYRRSMYTFWRRTAPPPSMLLFDATSREVCTAKRENTATPLQSLVLLNDPQFVEASRVLAEKMLKLKLSETETVQRLFRTVTGRLPSEKERKILITLLTEQRKYFKDTPSEAAKYLAIGETKPDKTLTPEDLAAWAVVANTLLNHDDFVMKK